MKFLFKIMFLSLATGLIFNSSCSNHSNGNFREVYLCGDTLKSSEKLDSVKIPVFQIDSIFYGYLDTIVSAEIHCSNFDSCNRGFIYTTSLIMSQFKNHDIMISAIDINRFDYSKCIGIFEYKNFRFVCDSICNEDFLIPTNNVLNIKYISSNETKISSDIDDRYSNWLFNMDGNKIICTGHYTCP